MLPAMLPAMLLVATPRVAPATDLEMAATAETVETVEMVVTGEMVEMAAIRKAA
jgi:hypothetical protein